MNISKIASFDVDAQKSFTPLCPNELPVEGGDTIGSELNRMAAIASFRVGSKDAHTTQAPWVVNTHSDMLQPTGLEHADLTWVSHCVPGTEGFKLLDDLPQPLDYDYFIWKGVEPEFHPYGACYHDLSNKLSTGVIEFLKAKGVECILVGGLALDFCVKTTALQLAKANFISVIVYLPSCRAISEAGAEEAILEMRAAGIKIANNYEELTKLAESA